MMNESFEDRPIILTNHPGRDKSPTWASVSVEHRPVQPKGVMGDLTKAWQLFRKRGDYKVVVLGGGARYDLFYLLLQSIWPWSKVPVIKIDCLWYNSSPLKHLLKKVVFKFVDRSISKYVVWASREIKDYANAFDLDAAKFCFIPYHTTIDPKKVNVKNKGYLFSGGNFARDYKTLADAVRGLDMSVVIACSNEKALEGIDFPDNVKAGGVSHDEFMQLLSESFINVIPLTKGLLHSGGQQTFLNAMLMGKPVVVTDPEGAADYIEDGVNGYLVQPGDVTGLRDRIVALMDNQEWTPEKEHNARTTAITLDTEFHFSNIKNLAIEAIESSK